MTMDWDRRTVLSDANGEGVELAVFEGGNPSGPTLVMVHGWPDTHRLWSEVAERLTAEFRLVAYDTRGQGESGEPEDDAAYELEHLAADFRAVIDAVSPEESVHVLAHDWGSVEVWEAVCDPTFAPRVASFVSISGPNLDHLGQWFKDQLSRPTPLGLGHALAQGASSAYVSFFVSPLAPPTFRRFGSRGRWAGLLGVIEGVEPSEEHHAPTLVHDMVSGLRRYRANVRSRMRHPQPRRTRVPVLQLVAARDVAVRSAALRCSEAYVDDLRRRVVPYGHWVVLAHPEVVAEETRRFVESVRRSAGD